MKSRQVVCSDPRVLRLLDKFVPVADAPGPFRRALETKKTNSLEYRLLHDAMKQTEFRNSMGNWHVQGMYVLSPSGRLLAGRNTVSDTEATLREMRKGLDEYAKLPRHERLLPRTPDVRSDAINGEQRPSPPEGGLVLRMVSRTQPVRGLNVSPEDTRHPKFPKLDRLWYTRSEARAFVPAPMRVGAKAKVTGAVLARLVRLHLGVFVQPNLYWQPGDVKEAQLTSEVVAVRGTVVEVKFKGNVRLNGENPHNKRRYDADLLGKATYDAKRQRFLAFELLALGDHTIGSEEHPEEKTRTVPVGVYFSLNGVNPNDNVAPEHYGLYEWAI